MHLNKYLSKFLSRICWLLIFFFFLFHFFNFCLSHLLLKNSSYLIIRNTWPWNLNICGFCSFTSNIRWLFNCEIFHFYSDDIVLLILGLTRISWLTKIVIRIIHCISCLLLWLKIIFLLNELVPILLIFFSSELLLIVSEVTLLSSAIHSELTKFSSILIIVIVTFHFLFL